ncbi:bifunctional DNA primase/polymerase [Streptomyces sp. RY43-2]|uniref:Bifunctional DNA primase/polymerase n=1 Tax=Streptomyces macrolidinus TaxID=2952607 RepID=A0ABT0ZI58_9ACTN|nr:bifunctional DNA primase/polymerase [Streptomyces macrolidinus]MCN9243269.1 bifunctional DNA primase/polymerase [Streptomyces macrolidinus]
MEETIAGPQAAHIPKRRGDSIAEAAVRYVEERHWDVFPGTWLEARDGTLRCSCGESACPAPGAHPAREDWATQATGSATVARGLWSEHPTASILLPVGRTFDAIDVPETAGLLALARMERMELRLGPVTHAPDGRMQFFVLPGAAAKVPDLLRGLGWSPATLDLVALGEGTYVAAPPTRYGLRGPVQWACRPTSENRWLPDAEELISTLAYACGRDR